MGVDKGVLGGAIAPPNFVGKLHHCFSSVCNLEWPCDIRWIETEEHYQLPEDFEYM